MNVTNVPPLHADAPRGSVLGAVPYRNCKVIHLIRHGKGFHNEVVVQEDYKKWTLFDAHLTEQGWAQAAAVNKHLKDSQIEVDVVVVSPLTRTLETAVGCFAQHRYDPDSSGVPLMLAQTSEEGIRFEHAAMSSNGTPPFVANELCRETLGVHPCDSRRPMSYARKHFPAVDFSGIEHDEDVYWKEDIRETHDEIKARGHKFAAWLMKRPEKHIAVVSHSGFLFAFMQNFGQALDLQVSQHLHRHFNNCEMRTIVLMDAMHSDSYSDPHWFVGGEATPPA